MAMDTEASLREYLKLHLKVPLIGRIGPLARMFDFVANAAPGVKEILTVGKLCYEVRERRYDLVVVDASATGHVVGQLAAPQAINDLVKVGLIRAQTDWMLDILSDPRSTGLVIVTTPEEMPVNETIELADRVRDETTVDLAAVVVNRVLPELFGRGEEEVFDGCASPVAHRGRRRRRRRPAAAARAVRRLAVTLRRPRAVHLARLRSAPRPATCRCCTPALPPYLFARTHGLRSTRAVADSLGDELARWPPDRRGRAGRTAEPPARWSSCLAAHEIVSPAAPVAWGRRPRPQPPPPWPPSARAARCSCSPSTPPAAWPTPSG